MTLTLTAVRLVPGATLADPDFLAVTFGQERRVEGRSLSSADERRVGQMRRIVAERLRFWRLDHLADDFQLIVSELVTNARAP
ncbi:hypothetical protein [Streptomyces sp. GQFP]|uniref:hypothetical protein n=1 Tax=Streptomyces sp. GQFP TaxID=2907545 RepID=UPI001F1A6F9B|nr:hypothetical protein [Streptomyces sp. GQFP]UIX34261.1 hypothetical protein LUX31_32015 [Streptomyces sp. GQFP]